MVWALSSFWIFAVYIMLVAIAVPVKNTTVVKTEKGLLNTGCIPQLMNQ
jgi:hypothetical protein